jgi:hypothetical protein
MIDTNFWDGKGKGKMPESGFINEDFFTILLKNTAYRYVLAFKAQNNDFEANSSTLIIFSCIRQRRMGFFFLPVEERKRLTVQGPVRCSTSPPPKLKEHNSLILPLCRGYHYLITFNNGYCSSSFVLITSNAGVL